MGFPQNIPVKNKRIEIHPKGEVIPPLKWPKRCRQNSDCEWYERCFFWAPNEGYI